MKNMKILALVFFALNAFAMDGAKKKELIETTQKKTHLNPGLTADEVARIKHHMYKMYVHEMGIMDIDFCEMAHGNTDLAQDLKTLYWQSNNYPQAMKTLGVLCQKWGLELVESDEEKKINNH